MAVGSYNNGPIGVYVKQKNYVVYITHVPTDKSVAFPAFLTSFNDSYKSNWTTTSVIGRMDPIFTFQQTSRSITIGFTIPSADESEAKKNLENARELTKYLYPTYQDPYNATQITKAPLVRIKFANLIGRGVDCTGGGLLGKLQNASINPNNDEGYFDPKTFLYPKSLNMNLVLDVVHESHPGGWDIAVEPPDPRETEEEDSQSTNNTQDRTEEQENEGIVITGRVPRNSRQQRTRVPKEKRTSVNVGAFARTVADAIETAAQTMIRRDIAERSDRVEDAQRGELDYQDGTPVPRNRREEERSRDQTDLRDLGSDNFGEGLEDQASEAEVLGTSTDVVNPGFEINVTGNDVSLDSTGDIFAEP